MAAVIIPNDSSTRKEVIAIFGLGLIGSATLQHICRAQRVSVYTIPSGHTTFKHEHHTSLFVERFCSVLRGIDRRGRGPVPLKVLWSAGSAGFAASNEQVQQEMELFSSALDACEVLSSKGTVGPVSFALLSSAGGIFEGVRLIDDVTAPCPRRPYGFFKLAQEEALRAAHGLASKVILRLTTVYGYIRPRQRSSVIGTMVLNGLRQKETKITGRMSTLRDYIWIEDLAQVLSEVILRESEVPLRSLIVASAKPCSLLEIQDAVERTIGTKLYVSYDLDPTNAEDITVVSNASLLRCQSSVLRVNVRKMYVDLLGSTSYGWTT